MKEIESSSLFPTEPSTLSQDADSLYLTIQNRIVHMGDLEVFSRLSCYYEMISTLKNMEELKLLSAAEKKWIVENLVRLEEEVRSIPLDLTDQLEMVKESLFNLLAYFQRGSTNAKIIYLLSQLPLLFCQSLTEQKAEAIKKLLLDKILSIQKLLQTMSSLEQKHLQQKLAAIEENLQKRKADKELSEKDLDEFFKNLEL